MTVRHAFAAALSVAAITLPTWAHAQTALRFDLVCTGTWLADDKPEAPWAARFAVDLVKGLYCRDGCKAPTAISAVRDDKLVLTHNVTQSGEVSRMTVDRITGEFMRESIFLPSKHFLRVNAKCQKAAYTGMPSTLY